MPPCFSKQQVYFYFFTIAVKLSQVVHIHKQRVSNSVLLFIGHSKSQIKTPSLQMASDVAPRQRAPSAIKSTVRIRRLTFVKWKRETLFRAISYAQTNK